MLYVGAIMIINDMTAVKRGNDPATSYLYFNQGSDTIQSGKPSTMSYTGTEDVHNFTISSTSPIGRNYRFSNWKSNNTGTTYSPGASVPVNWNSNDTLTAQWGSAKTVYDIIINESGLTQCTGTRFGTYSQSSTSSYNAPYVCDSYRFSPTSYKSSYPSISTQLPTDTYYYARNYNYTIGFSSGRKVNQTSYPSASGSHSTAYKHTWSVTSANIDSMFRDILSNSQGVSTSKQVSFSISYKLIFYTKGNSSTTVWTNDSNPTLDYLTAYFTAKTDGTITYNGSSQSSTKTYTRYTSQYLNSSDAYFDYICTGIALTSV